MSLLLNMRIQKIKLKEWTERNQNKIFLFQSYLIFILNIKFINMTLSLKELASQLEAAKTKNKELDNQNEKLLANKTEILKKIEVLRQAESNEESKDSKTFILNDK